MGEVKTEVTLVNMEDAITARNGYIPESQVRRLTVNALVVTKLYMPWALLSDSDFKKNMV